MRDDQRAAGAGRSLRETLDQRGQNGAAGDRAIRWQVQYPRRDRATHAPGGTKVGAVAGVVGNLGDVVSGLFNEP